jgi:hypothetical protein
MEPDVHASLSRNLIILVRSSRFQCCAEQVHAIAAIGQKVGAPLELIQSCPNLKGPGLLFLFDLNDHSNLVAVVI